MKISRFGGYQIFRRPHLVSLFQGKIKAKKTQAEIDICRLCSWLDLQQDDKALSFADAKSTDPG